MARADLDDFVLCYKSRRRHQRVETDRFQRLDHAELVARDKVNLDIFWLKDDTLDDPDLLLPPNEIAAEIIENPEASDRFRKVALSFAARVSDHGFFPFHRTPAGANIVNSPGDMTFRASRKCVQRTRGGAAIQRIEVNRKIQNL